jgi:hypothetical protein
MMLIHLLLVVKCISGFVDNNHVSRLYRPVGDGKHFKPLQFAIRSVTPVIRPSLHSMFASNDEDNAQDMESETPVLIRAEDMEDIDGSIFEDMDTGKPPEWMVMKEVSSDMIAGDLIPSHRMASNRYCYRFSWWGLIFLPTSWEAWLCSFCLRILPWVQAGWDKCLE